MASEQTIGRWWTLGRTFRCLFCLACMIVAPWLAWEGRIVFAVLTLGVWQAAMSWERAIQRREGWR